MAETVVAGLVNTAGILVDLGALHGAGLVAAASEFLRMGAIVLAHAEDVAPRRDRCEQLDLVQRNRRTVDRQSALEFIVSLDETDHVVQGRIERPDARGLDIDDADALSRSFRVAGEFHCGSSN